ncbi:nucleotidyltransferase substrate binding protein [Caldicellulosiruptor danielii]|uniref:Nucleotidyltransferase substrate binding protein n=1 Tax=Anaerocellum danielii TaxID=1387557 RepID=A0ABZ0U288_9FIRM|nr:nucleotidyltransferase substrate binding protein [Caldicellulosiruptor danielii]WPX09831.1 nucleotidyltransferase substrate binding protein [Caldicellulosiruptor danielii]
MNNLEKIRNKFANFRKALLKLKEAVEERSDNPLLYDGAIQRFEFTYELAWKLLKAYLEYQGIVSISSPRAVFKEAFSVCLIENQEKWLRMIEDRNLTVHTYDECVAKAIFERIKSDYLPLFEELEKRFEELIR